MMEPDASDQGEPNPAQGAGPGPGQEDTDTRVATAGDAVRDTVAAAAVATDAALSITQCGVDAGFWFGERLASGLSSLAICGAAYAVAMGQQGDVSNTTVAAAVVGAGVLKAAEVRPCFVSPPWRSFARTCMHARGFAPLCP